MKTTQVADLQNILKYLEQCPVDYKISSMQSGALNVKFFCSVETPPPSEPATAQLDSSASGDKLRGKLLALVDSENPYTVEQYKTPNTDPCWYVTHPTRGKLSKFYVNKERAQAAATKLNKLEDSLPELETQAHEDQQRLRKSIVNGT
jgi:hypothetical protein